MSKALDRAVKAFRERQMDVPMKPISDTDHLRYLLRAAIRAYDDGVMREDIQADAIRLLETPFWPEGLETRTRYYRPHDDEPPANGHGISVVISNDGDVWPDLQRAPFIGPRYRMPMIGGGASPRVRNALLLLALAIKLDNAERPLVPDA